MDQGQCSRCGQEITGGGDGYCPDCRDDVRRKRLKGRWFLISAVVILILAGTVYSYGEKNAWEFSWDALLGRPAAVVDGEPVDRSALRERTDISRRMVEREYGKELFAGDRGRVVLAELERDVLEKMVEERLVAQEARRLNITVSDELVDQEMRKIGREIYGTWEKFQASLQEDGITPEYLTAHVRNLLLFREVNKAKAPPGENPDRYASVWLVQARKNANITVNKTAGPARAAFRGTGSGCGSGGGGCGGCGGSRTSAGAVDPELQSKASAAALDAYHNANPAGKGVRAQVSDYGCHVQVDIEQDGKVVKSYVYQDGEVIES